MSCNQKNNCGPIIIAPQGPSGAPGQPGSQIFTNIGPPSQALGVNGDLYIDTTNGNYYQKIGGVWILQGNLQGPQGPPGEPGSQIFTGDGVPPLALGVNGDFYVDNLTGDYYTKIGGLWVLQGNLQGPPGTPGSQIFTGDGVPPPALGSDGDFYLDNLTGDYYTKIGGVWTLQGNLQGPSGLSPSIFGSGRDGDVVIAASMGLIRDMVYNNLTVNPGVSLDTSGFRIFVRGVLINNGTIQNNGNPGTNVGGLATTMRTLGIGAAGGNPPSGSGSPNNNIPTLSGGNSLGGMGGGISGGGGGTYTTSTNGGDIPLNNLIEIVKVRSLDNLRYNGGTGGGAGQGAGGGGGGGGGGVLAIFANVIVNNGVISALGGNGGPSANATDGGGGGGGGGLLVYATTSITGNIPTLANVAGGLGGIGGTIGNGSSGTAGSVYGLIV